MTLLKENQPRAKEGKEADEVVKGFWVWDNQAEERWVKILK